VVETNLVGAYNADNVMAALAVGEYFGVSVEDGVKAIEAYVPSNNRSQMTKTERNTLIVDAYNANPTSMAAALENFSNVEADCKVALLGDMLELGEESQSEHLSVIESAVSRNFAKVCFVGKEFMKASEQITTPESVLFFETSDVLADWLRSNLLSGATVLIKGSRGTRMEKTVPEL
jgi:UDP-N-acetylmuramoyl-tripeptide--D-alanyl-D-alanine ligase